MRNNMPQAKTLGKDRRLANPLQNNYVSNGGPLNNFAELGADL